MREKLSLRNMERQAYNVNAKRLMATGVIPHEDKPSSEPQMLTVEQTGGLSESFVHAPSVGGYAIVVWVRIVALESGINVCECQITPQRWNDTNIFLVEATEGVPYYKAIGGIEYPKTDVLNDRISSKRSLRRRETLEGAIVAQSFGSLPTWCDNGVSIELELSFIDQLDNFYPLKVDLRVMRDPKRIGRPRGYAGLYGPAVNASMHGTYGEKPDQGDRDRISPKQPTVPRRNGPIA
jgi:hypothetical protein